MLRIILALLVAAPIVLGQPYFDSHDAWKIRGKLISTTVPTNGQTLVYNATTKQWVPGAGGGGASSLAGLTDLLVTKTSSTVLNIAAGNGAINNVVTPYAAATATISGSTTSGTAYIYVDEFGVLTVGHNTATTITCSAGCTTATGIATPPFRSVQIATATWTSNVWDTSGIIDLRALTRNPVYLPGTGIGFSYGAGGQITITNTGAGVQFAPNAQVGTTYPLTSANCGQFVTFSNAAGVAVSLPATPLASTCTVLTKCIGAGSCAVTPLSGTISGTSAITLNTGEYAWIISDGTNYQAASTHNTQGTGILQTFSNTGIATAIDTAVIPTIANVQTGSYVSVSDAGGDDTYVGTLSPAIAAYAANICVNLTVATANTGPATLELNGLGTRSILRADGTSLLNGDVGVGFNRVCDNGTAFLLPFRDRGRLTLAGNNISSVVGASVTTYQGAYQSSFNATEGNKQTLVPQQCKLRNLIIQSTSTQSGTGAVVVTVRVNGAAPGGGPTVTFTAGLAASKLTDNSNEVVVQTNDLLSFEFANAASVNSATFTGYSVQCVF